MKSIAMMCLSLLCILAPITAAQVSVPMTADRWEIHARNPKFDKYEGVDSIYGEGGEATLKGVDFIDGSVEFDIFMQNKFSFPGIRFRVLSDLDYEEFYLRPFESGKDDADQYSPVFNGVDGWQLYTGEGFSKAFDFPMTRWMHVRLVVDGNYGEFYFDSGPIPALIISELKREPRAGRIALILDHAHFANFAYSLGKLDEQQKAPLPRTVRPADNIVKKWRLSGVLKEAELSGMTTLDSNLLNRLEWTPAMAESGTGLVNIARTRKRDAENDTVFAAVTIESDRDQVKKFSFGFSDRVKVFFNDRLMYGANDGFRTRDFRFLGTIGYFDDLYLPLRKGRNLITLAVSESFGGWGVQGKFENIDGLRFDDN